MATPHGTLQSLPRHRSTLHRSKPRYDGETWLNVEHSAVIDTDVIAPDGRNVRGAPHAYRTQVLQVEAAEAVREPRPELAPA
jgi:hypothetical protein